MASGIFKFINNLKLILKLKDCDLSFQQRSKYRASHKTHKGDRSYQDRSNNYCFFFLYLYHIFRYQDLLPHFNENIKIEHFKDEICNSLNEYNTQIESLKVNILFINYYYGKTFNSLKWKATAITPNNWKTIYELWRINTLSLIVPKNAMSVFEAFIWKNFTFFPVFMVSIRNVYWKE